MGVRVNCGCGEFPLPGWINIDELGGRGVDVAKHVPPLPFGDESVDEVYAGHFLEHLHQGEACAFLLEAKRVLRPGGRLGLMVPDMREVMRRYVVDEPAPMEFPAGVHRDLRDLDELCAAVIFSTEQESHHQWAYDATTLTRLLVRHDFVVDGEFDRWSDPRVPVGAWYQVGVDAHKPGEWS